MISILSATLSQYDTSASSVYPFQIAVRIQCAKKYFARLKKSGSLGGLYNRDTSNALYQITEGRLPHCQVMLVNENRAKGDAKEIELRYIFSDAEAAKALGMQGFEATFKEGKKFIPKSGQYINILNRGIK